MARRIVNLVSFTVEQIEKNPEGSEGWLHWASKIEMLHEATIGSSVGVQTRSLLLDSIDLASLFCAMTGDQREWFRGRMFAHLEWRELGVRTPQHDAEVNFSAAFGASIPFIQHVKKWPWEDASAFVTFDFSSRAPLYAPAIRTSDAQERLKDCLRVWRVRGRPSKDAHGRPGKWLTVHLLMGSVGLEGATSETLEAEWKACSFREHQELREDLLKKERPATSDLSLRKCALLMNYAVKSRSTPLRCRARKPHVRGAPLRRGSSLQPARLVAHAGSTSTRPPAYPGRKRSARSTCSRLAHPNLNPTAGRLNGLQKGEAPAASVSCPEKARRKQRKASHHHES